MNEFIDEQLGLVKIRRNPKSRGISFRISQKGVLTASVARRTSLATIRRTVRSARPQLQALLDEHRRRVVYRDGQDIGKSHRLAIRTAPGNKTLTIYRRQRRISVDLPTGLETDDPSVQSVIQAEVIKVLKREADVYLKRRLHNLALRHNYSYQKVRLTHTGTRWGSCSSTGTISLNIALMMLPLELIDYVLVHELCHTKEMNHSDAFWRLVELADSDFRMHRQAIKQYTPAL